MFEDPSQNCNLCPRLVEFRQQNQNAFPGFHNAPVPAFGPLEAELLVVGLAPGLKGANFSGRPFTGDYAGDLLYPTLIKFGFAQGNYQAHADDGLKMVNCRITNAVRCVPPQNKPIAQEENACRTFLISEIKTMKNLKAVLALGGLAHKAVLKTLNLKLSNFKFSHNNREQLSDNVYLFSSYHCSRYNTNTGRLTTEMFEDVFINITKALN